LDLWWKIYFRDESDVGVIYHPPVTIRGLRLEYRHCKKKLARLLYDFGANATDGDC